MNSIDPRSMKTTRINNGAAVEGEEIGELAPSEDLMLRVEQIFEEAEELWQWMYNE
jgi:hypothetical protein